MEQHGRRARGATFRVDAASAALMALDYDVDVATRSAGLYAGLGGAGSLCRSRTD